MDYFNRWGRHYLPSLARAHLVQQCNNFKDPGVQAYGGKLFQELRDAVDDIFCKLPPPKPSCPVFQGGSYGGWSQGAAPPPVNMSTFHNRSNPCFTGDSVVSMFDGTTKSVGSIIAGDVVAVGATKCRGVVVCVVRTSCRRGKELIV